MAGGFVFGSLKMEESVNFLLCFIFPHRKQKHLAKEEGKLSFPVPFALTTIPYPALPGLSDWGEAPE